MYSLFIDQNYITAFVICFVFFYYYKLFLLVTTHLKKKLVWHKSQKELLAYIDRPIKKFKFNVGGYGPNFISWDFVPNSSALVEIHVKKKIRPTLWRISLPGHGRLIIFIFSFIFY